MTEDELAYSIISYLVGALTQEHRTAVLSGSGCQLAIVGRGRIYLIFCQSPAGEEASEREHEFRAWCAVNATPYCVARSIDDMRVALDHWRIPVKEAA